jgi:hypothetical protein
MSSAILRSHCRVKSRLDANPLMPSGVLEDRFSQFPTPVNWDTIDSRDKDARLTQNTPRMMIQIRSRE